MYDVPFCLLDLFFLTLTGNDRSSPVPPSTPPMPTPVKSSSESPPSLTQSPLILQPLASPLQVGVPPMSLPIILNPALIEATSPVPLLPAPRPAGPADTSEVKLNMQDYP